MIKQLFLALGLLTLVGLPSAFAADSDSVTVTATVTPYAQVDCANPSAITLTTSTTSPSDTVGYSSSGTSTINCSMLTNSANASLALTLGGGNYNNTNSRISTTHASVGTEHLDMELSNPTGFDGSGDHGLLTGGGLAPNTGVNLETASSFGWDVDVLADLNSAHLAGSYTGSFTVSLSGY